ncbi:MAG: hypothetical protein FJ270_03340 [Planctomycetes bacterium]|nr:hypothetical protein [Planctomycetota bacterium]
MKRRDQDMSVAESLGAFVGAIWSGITSRPGKPARPESTSRTVATRVEDREVDGVVLRRTIIDEVIVPPTDGAAQQDHRTNHATH